VEVEQEMKIECLAAMLAMAGASLCAGQSAATQKATVNVCMETDPYILMGVRPLASAMFASIGVRIAWHELDSCPAEVGAIQVRLSHDSPSIRNSASEAALAFARPYEGTIVVFVERVRQSHRDGARLVMAHVLVHEITHVLEGIDRHSATGIMKARWNDHDYFEMRRKPLLFAQEDVNLIYDGLKVPRMAPAAVLTRVTRAAVAGP
jgi:hypothetical protein